MHESNYKFNINSYMHKLPDSLEVWLGGVGIHNDTESGICIYFAEMDSGRFRLKFWILTKY